MKMQLIVTNVIVYRFSVRERYDTKIERAKVECNDCCSIFTLNQTRNSLREINDMNYSFII